MFSCRKNFAVFCPTGSEVTITPVCSIQGDGRKQCICGSDQCPLDDTCRAAKMPNQISSNSSSSLCSSSSSSSCSTCSPCQKMQCDKKIVSDQPAAFTLIYGSAGELTATSKIFMWSGCGENYEKKFMLQYKFKVGSWRLFQVHTTDSYGPTLYT